MKHLKWALVLTVILVLPCVAVAVPQLINYQGELSDISGNPIHGDLSITFTIYNASTAGDVLWTETQNVTVTDGVFNVLLGSMNSNIANAFDGNERYLGVKVGTDEEMTPRQRFASVPFAIMAEKASCHPGDFIGCYTGDPSTKGVSQCNSGIRTCGPEGTYGACDGEITPVAEVCGDGLDNNCDGQVDDNCVVDLDADGYDEGADCNDSASSCTTDCVTDSDADGIADCLDLCIDNDFDNYGADNSAAYVGAGAYSVASCTVDGVTACSFSDAACVSNDCDDETFAINPGATEIVADGIDQDCDGGDTCYQDLDGDFFGSDTLVLDNDLSCNNGSVPYVTWNNLDCNDINFSVNPGTTETCGTPWDDDCDGDANQHGAAGCNWFYYDADGDNFGVIGNSTCRCTPPAGYVSASGDCNDADNNVYPGSGC